MSGQLHSNKHNIYLLYWMRTLTKYSRMNYMDQRSTREYVSYLWINPFYIRIHFNTIKSRILDIFKQSWYSNINNSNRLETYCLYEFIFESYLDQVRDSRFSICLTRLKSSSHDLAIEKGRHQNIARQEHVCNNCTMSVLETEYHYLLVCPKFYNLRTKYIKKYYYTWPTLHKLTHLLSSKSNITVQNLSKFIVFANRIRN